MQDIKELELLPDDMKRGMEALIKFIKDLVNPIIQAIDVEGFGMSEHGWLSANKEIIIQDCSMMKGDPMSKNFFEEPVLYTTGAYIQPLKVIDRDGSERWFWVVSEFDGDTFMDGETFNPVESSQTKQELLLAQQ